MITSIDGKTIASASDLTSLMFPYHPDDKVDVGWVDQSGDQHQRQRAAHRRPARPERTARIAPGPLADQISSGPYSICSTSDARLPA